MTHAVSELPAQGEHAHTHVAGLAKVILKEHGFGGQGRRRRDHPDVYEVVEAAATAAFYTPRASDPLVRLALTSYGVPVRPRPNSIAPGIDEYVLTVSTEAVRTATQTPQHPRHLVELIQQYAHEGASSIHYPR